MRSRAARISSSVGRCGGASDMSRDCIGSRVIRCGVGTPHAPQSVMSTVASDASRTSTTRPRQSNVSNPERWISIAAGGAMAAYGLARRSAGGLTLAGLGSALVWRGATGHCSLYEALGISTNGHTAAAERPVSVPYGKGIRVERSVTVAAAPEALYAFWRNF